MAKLVLAAVCVALMANVAFAQKGVFSAANVVPSWDACPVKKPAEWDPKVFDPSLDALTELTEYTKGLSKACQDTLLDLAGCASDNDAFANPPSTITSLSTSDGCCLTDCSNNIKKAIKQGCFNDLLGVICKDTKADKFKTGLFNAGARCADFTPSCDKAPAAPAAAAPAAAAPAAANATVAAAKDAVANATAGAKDTLAAAKTAGAEAVKKATAGAGAVAASAVIAVAGAAALLAM